MFTGIRLYALLGFAAVAAIFIGFALHWKHQAADRGEKLVLICQTTRTAANNPKLACGQVAVQISEMGKSIASLKEGIAHQNEAVNAMAAKTAQAQAESKQASQRAEKAARGAQATSVRLEASSRAGERQAKPCVPSKALTEAWR